MAGEWIDHGFRHPRNKCGHFMAPVIVRERRSPRRSRSRARWAYIPRHRGSTSGVHRMSSADTETRSGLTPELGRDNTAGRIRAMRPLPLLAPVASSARLSRVTTSLSLGSSVTPVGLSVPLNVRIQRVRREKRVHVSGIEQPDASGCFRASQHAHSRPRAHGFFAHASDARYLAGHQKLGAQCRTPAPVLTTNGLVTFASLSMADHRSSSWR